MSGPLGAMAILGGRREQALLELPSVSRMAGMLADRCREVSWVRTSVASLDRFRSMTGHVDLEELLERARNDAGEAQRALLAFASELDEYEESQIAGLAMGPKIWFRLNGVPVPWRPLPAERSSPPRVVANQRPADSLVLLALIGSGLRRAELLRLRLGDVGSLDSECRIVPDVEAEPLAVRYVPRTGQQGERITFLTYAARQVMLAELSRRRRVGQPCGADAPLVARADGSPATAASVAGARRRTASLIRAGTFVNIDLCRATGDFFREWGMPGSKFEGEDDLNIEEYI